MTKVLIDTNIFIYDLDKNSKFHSEANKLLNSENELYTTSKNVSEFICVCTKLSIDYNIIEKYIEDIFSNLTILYPTPYSLEIFLELTKKNKPNGNRVYDIEIASIMIDNQILNIATFNMKDFEMIENFKTYN